MTEAAHSILGPSSSERWLNCPGSVLATKDLPEEPTEFSADGTFSHSVAEEARRLDVRVAALIGRKGEVDGFKFVVDAQRAEHLQEYIDYVNGIPGDDYNEQRVRYEPYVRNGFGTMDAAKAATRRAHIIDLKYGEGIQVFAQDNSQLKLYALGFYLEYGWLYDLHDFVLTVFQPRLQHVDSFVITVEELLKWAEEVVKPTAAIAMQPGAPFKAGGWCTKGFCKIRRTCKTRAQAVFGAVSGEMEDLDAAMKATPRPCNTLTADQVASALRAKKIATGWFSDLEEFAISELAHGREIGSPSWKMVEGRSTRTFALPEEKVVEEIVATVQEQSDGTFDKDEFRKTLYSEPALKSAPQIEELLGKKWFAPAKVKEDGTVVKDAGPLAQLIAKPQGKPVLAPPEDPRESLKVNAATELENLDSFDI